jgi:beta-aspartyl-peptidase (threonine type)
MSQTDRAEVAREVIVKVALVVLGGSLASLAWGLSAWHDDEGPAPADAPPGALAPPWRDDEVPRAIRRVLDDQDRAWNRGDLEGFMAGYLRSPQLTFLSGRDPQRGWEKTLERYRERYQRKGNEMGRLSFSDLDVRLLRRDLALVTGRWKLVRKKDAPDGLFTLLMWQTPEGWRIVHDHTSAGEPPAKKAAPAP